MPTPYPSLPPRHSGNVESETNTTVFEDTMDTFSKNVDQLMPFKTRIELASLHCNLVYVLAGQYPVLVAAGTGQGTPFIMTFGDGQSTADVLSYMPVCIVTSGSAPFIRLEKTDGSLVLGVTGSFTGFGRAPLNTTAHPSLNASYTGVYHCRTDARYSPQLYQLNVVGKVKFEMLLMLSIEGSFLMIPCIAHQLCIHPLQLTPHRHHNPAS